MIADNECPLIDCPACSVSTSLIGAFSEGETDFLICQHCGLAFRERLPSLDELTSIYITNYSEANIIGGHTEQESGEFALGEYFRFLRKILGPKDGRIFDYGAGTGRLVEMFRLAGYEADGLEFSPTARQYCQETRGFDLFANVGQLSMDAYNLITMIEVIEHLPNLVVDLTAIRDSLSPGGTLFITTPNRMGLRARLQKGYWSEARKKFHLFLFDRKSLERTLRKAGFSSVKLIQFSPVQKKGLRFWVYGRICQCLGLSGTLCVEARR